MKSEQSGRKDFFFSKEAKVTVDILLVVGLIVAGIGSHMETAPGHYWQSAHCITGALWFLLVTVHVAQNWRMIKGFSRKKVIGKNRITFFTLIVFALMFISIVSFVGGLSFLFFHFFIGKLFTLTVFIHVIDKFKRLVRLCKNMG